LEVHAGFSTSQDVRKINVTVACKSKGDCYQKFAGRKREMNSAMKLRGWSSADLEQMSRKEKDDRAHGPFMTEALKLAQRAYVAGEVPIGAVVVVEGQVVGRGYNQSLRKSDPTAHAEILALRQAARKAGNYRLTSATLYCTLEPCAMCAGALVWARVERLVYGARDRKAGAIDSHLGLAQAGFLNHQFEVLSGVMETESATLLQRFFRTRRHE
jgi:tRNA(adenine34) deaminase